MNAPRRRAARRNRVAIDRALFAPRWSAWCAGWTHNPAAKLLAKTLDSATEKLLDNNQSPSPTTDKLDNRSSQFYLAMYCV